ncbi:hypothetical protein AHAS_Ahas11G0174800 [Arachis hypogaea]
MENLVYAKVNLCSPSCQELLLDVIVILSVATTGLSMTPSFSVLQYGAVGNEQTNDSPAFEKAWKAVCSSKGEISKLIIPAGLRQLDLIAAVHQGIDKFTKGSISLLRLKVVFCSPQKYVFSSPQLLKSLVVGNEESFIPRGGR